MIIKQLKKIAFEWDGKAMTLSYPYFGDQEITGFRLSRVHLLSLMRFGLRVLSKKK
jgi:hypothetical protein